MRERGLQPARPPCEPVRADSCILASRTKLHTAAQRRAQRTDVCSSTSGASAHDTAFASSPQVFVTATATTLATGSSKRVPALAGEQSTLARPRSPLPVRSARFTTGRLGIPLGLPLENGAALRLLARRASSSCLRSRSFSASARSNSFSSDSTRLSSSSFSRSEGPPRSGDCIHLTMAQTGSFVRPLISLPCVY